MVAQQKIKDSSLDCVTEISALPTSAGKGNPGSPKSKLAKLKRSSTKAKASVNGANDPFRFQGNGVDFKGKMIGERDVAEARGDSMCAEAMRLAKASVKSAGSHKQRIILNISIEGLKIKDEKSGSVFHNFPVAKISFIARDTTDARAFGFIFGTSGDKYKFYGIKTAQTADHAVLSIRDMFQVVFEMKKKQIMEVKQKQEEQENMERESTENGGSGCRIEDGVAVADLLDLESELQNLEQGFNQLQNIPSMPEDEGFLLSNGWHTNGASLTARQDPFGDSFNPNPVNIFAPVNPTLNAWPTPQNGHNIQPTSTVYSGTNPFSMLNQPQPAVPGVFATLAGSAVAPIQNGNGSHVVDPFDTQSAHRLINAINNTHSFGLPIQQQQHCVPTIPSAPPVVASLPMPVSMPTEVNWGVGSSATSLKENKAPNGTDFVAHFGSENGHSSGTEKQMWEEPKRVTTLEEAFSKLVDMNQLVSSSAAVTSAVRKNPFEHILNPPKMPLNALAGGSVPASNGYHHTTNGSCSAVNGHNGSSNGMGIRAGVSSDPFNDDFFN
uniref:PID domain-containing protein n=1 Tax=Ditylenchus dipsaci TaxID=166011 RepID=A0A915EF83_9BILA